MGIYHDEDVSNGLGDGQEIVDGGPGAWVGVDDDGQERGRLAREGALVVVLRGIDAIHLFFFFVWLYVGLDRLGSNHSRVSIWDGR